jgi:hypothetical protein
VTSRHAGEKAGKIPAAEVDKVGHSMGRSSKQTAGVQHGRSANQVKKAAGELFSLPTPNVTSAGRIVNKTASLKTASMRCVRFKHAGSKIRRCARHALSMLSTSRQVAAS